LSDDYIVVSDIESLKLLSTCVEHYYVLGEGSNVLFAESNAPKLIKPMFKGVDIKSTSDAYYITVGAGENWHQLVCQTIENNMPGLENLALIPGSVGAAPIQNIGAYGVEFADVCHSVSWYDFNLNELIELDKADCKFGYRDSVFKTSKKGKGLIVGVTIKLNKKWIAKLDYAGLNKLPANIDAKTVMNTVISIRKSKLPDPEILPNAGSFFKNPLISNEFFNALQNEYPDIPHYLQTNGEVKLAAGWLIEKSDLKGFRINDAGVHKNQALVLVNYGKATGKEMINLASLVIDKVFKKFNVLLEPEVRIVKHSGECSIEELI